MICGAWGGRPDKDGLEAVTNASQNMSNMPVEVMEAEHPVRVEEYAFVPDTCGAGQLRGGARAAAAYRMLADEALLQLRTDRMVFQPYGLAGGGAAARDRATSSNPDSGGEPLPGKVTTTLRGDVILHEQAGGGGHGDPLERALDALGRDLADGKISPAFATAITVPPSTRRPAMSTRPRPAPPRGAARGRGEPR